MWVGFPPPPRQHSTLYRFSLYRLKEGLARTVRRQRAAENKSWTHCVWKPQWNTEMWEGPKDSLATGLERWEEEMGKWVRGKEDTGKDSAWRLEGGEKEEENKGSLQA